METSPYFYSAGLTTNQLARALDMAAQSIRKRHCQTGSYFGVRPVKLRNGRLVWPLDSVGSLLSKELK